MLITITQRHLYTTQMHGQMLVFVGNYKLCGSVGMSSPNNSRKKMMLELIITKDVLGGCRGGDGGPQEDVFYMRDR